MNNLPSLPTSQHNTEADRDRQEARIAQQLLFGHASSLLSNESFTFFLEKTVGQKIKDLEATALDPDAPEDDRTFAVQVRKLLKEIYDWPAETKKRTAAMLADDKV